MSKSTILELSQSNADVVHGPGDYEVNLASSVIMEQGDQINLKMASIDSQQNDDETIVIPPQTNVAITFSYYDVLYNEGLKVLNTGGKVPTRGAALPAANVDFTSYALYKERGTVRLSEVGWKIYPDQRGVEGVDGFVQDFTVYWIDVDGNSQSAKYEYNAGPNDFVIPNGYRTAINPPASNVKYLGTGAAPDIVARDGTIKAICTQAWYDEKKFKYPNSGPSDKLVVWNPNTDVTAAVGAAGLNLDQQTVTINIPEGRYAPDSLAVFLTQSFAKSNGVDPRVIVTDNLFAPNNNLLVNSDDIVVGDFLLRRNENYTAATLPVVFDGTNTYMYANAANTLIGAGAFALEYGNAGTVFQVSDAHIPVYNAASPATRNVAYYQTGTAGVDLRYHEVTAESGIVVHDLQPSWFWERIGLDKWVVPLQKDTTGINYYHLNDLKNKTPTGFDSITNFLLTGDRSQPVPLAHNPYYVNIEVGTSAFLGEETRVGGSNGGYYLVEITGLNSDYSNYIDENQSRPNIVAIVSKQYDNNSLVTGFGDSGIVSTHLGNPFLINRARVRILDPITKEPVNTLGEYNSIFLELIKPLASATQQAAIKDQDQFLAKLKKVHIKRKN